MHKYKQLSALCLALTFYNSYSICKSQQQTVQKVLFKSRKQHMEQVCRNTKYDIVIIGGGCNGAGVALEASTRGLRTLLIDKSDFGSGASSKSTKLIHGGVRYLQQAFQISLSPLSERWEKLKLVCQAIQQRTHMLESASYMTQKIQIVLPCTNIFNLTYYYIGSVFYYAIYWFYQPKGQINFNFPFFLHRQQINKLFPYLSDNYNRGIVYEDGSFNDSRLLMISLLTATSGNGLQMPSSFKPANILNYTSLSTLRKNEHGKLTGVSIKDELSGKQIQIQAKYVVNCTGAWADTIRLMDNAAANKRICMVGGSHITYLPQIIGGKYGLCMPSADDRIILLVPWLHHVIVGTTEKKFEQANNNPTCSMDQRQFISSFMAKSMDKLPIEQLLNMEITHWCGLRALVSNGNNSNTKDISRNYVIQTSKSGLISLMGGKWTIYRKMGKDVINKILTEEQQKTGQQYPSSCLNEVPLIGLCDKSLRDQLMIDYGEIGLHLYESYGANAHYILQGDLTPICGNITRAEVQWIVKNQMVVSIEDILLRRTRAAFLYDKKSIMEAVGDVATIIYESQDLSQEQLSKIITESMQRISSYEFN